MSTTPGVFNFSATASKFPVSRSVQIWLMIGVFMIFMQVIIGGITRLTGSGLSITKWEIVTGTLPPIGEAQWNDAFELYKATPQYEKINKGMSIGDFKFIYFWEYIHRLWARTMGFVFLFPFLFFLLRGMLPKLLVQRLGVVILLAVLVASLGWIMVASGLIHRPWVNAYKLTLHLSIAFILYAYLLWTCFIAIQGKPKVINNTWLKKWGYLISGLLFVQIFLGGIMSGMKASLFFPTWPDMNGTMVPNSLFNISSWNYDNFVNYDSNPFMPALIQFFHRSTAYLLLIIVLYVFLKARNMAKPPLLVIGLNLLIGMLFIQVGLGIMTLINSVGIIPVLWGSLHQGGALFMLSIALFVNFQFSTKNY